MELDELLEGFSPPRVGEATFGIAARFFDHAQAKNSQKVHEYLFGYRTDEIASKYQGGLGMLVSRFPTAWKDPQDIINSHTIYPLYRPFMQSEDKANEIEELLIESKKSPGQKLRKIFQLTEGESLEKRQYPRFCVSRLNEDVNNSVTPTWYRHHQIPGVDWCVKHEKALTDSCLYCGEIYFKHSYVLPMQKYNCPGQFSVKGKRISRMVDYSMSEDIFRVRDDSDEMDLNYSRYVIAILEANLNPISSKNWIAVISAGIEMHGLKTILAKIDKVHNDLFFVKLVTKDYFKTLSRMNRQGERESYINGLSAYEKIQIIMTIFESPKEFLATLKQVHVNQLYAG